MTYVNDAATNLIGRKGDLVGKKMLEFIHPDDRGSSRRGLRERTDLPGPLLLLCMK